MRTRHCRSHMVFPSLIAAVGILMCLTCAQLPILRCDGNELAESIPRSRNKGASKRAAVKRNEVAQMGKIYAFKAKSIEGKEIDFSAYKGDVLLIVNTASECGFTPQYEGLEALQKQFQARGLKVLGFPCNQFGHQEPGDGNAIADFCHSNYGVTFQMFEKIDVNGKKAHPLYKYLTDCAPGVLGSEAIKWNFTKFLIDRKASTVKRFGPNVTPESIAPEIE